jgi:hypothetical protein
VSLSSRQTACLTPNLNSAAPRSPSPSAQPLPLPAVTLWTDIEILRYIDACEQGERSLPNTGAELARAMATERGTGVDAGDYARFLRELDVLGKAGLLEWQMAQIPAHVRQPSPDEPQWFLDHMMAFALTYDGRNHAKGRVIQVPLPDSGEDDERPIASLTLEYVAKSITRQLDQFQVAQLIIEGGISGEHEFPEHEGSFTDRLLVYFLNLSQGTSGHRRELRHFVGAWLDDQLYVGPSDDERERTESLLARQGWFVKDGRLVVGEPVRKSRNSSAPAPKLDELHPRVWAAAQPQWKARHLHDAVLAASKAVNAMLESKVGRSDVSEVKLVTEAFSEKPPTEVARRLRFPDIDGEQTRASVTAGVLSFGVGCFRAIRNPLGHLPDDQHDITEQEALEQLAAWSLFARWIERATTVSGAA